MNGAGIDLSWGFDPVDRETWRERVQADIGDQGIETLSHTLDGGVVIGPLYTEEDAPARETGWPGAPPFVRGAHASAGWRIVHEVSGDGAEAIIASAARARRGGADAVLLGPSAFDHLDAEALRGIGGPLVADPGADALAWLGALANVEAAELRFDPLGTLARTGRLPYETETAWRALSELAVEGRRVLVDVRPYHEGGAPPADEITFALATGLEYLRALSDRGHPLADAPRRMTFAFACDTDLFVAVAKLRAARLTWSKVLRALGVDGPGQGMEIHAFSSRRAHSVLEPTVNVLRGTTSAFAAIVGGAQALTLDPHQSTPRAERLARNTQLMLRWESHLDRVVDPAGGSYYVEALTESLARSAWEGFQTIERGGGMLEALTDGSAHMRIARAAALRRDDLAGRRRVRIGVNRYAGPDDPPSASPTMVAPREGSDERPEKSVAIEPIEPLRDAAEFEALRRRAAALGDDRREALVVGLGSGRTVRGPMEFAREALGVAGLRARLVDPRGTFEDLELDAVPPTVVICAAEPALARTAIAALRTRGAVQILLAGRPEEGEATDADAYLHRGMDSIAVLGSLLGRLEGAS